jgi:hypothetical protein
VSNGSLKLDEKVAKFVYLFQVQTEFEFPSVMFDLSNSVATQSTFSKT